jgi:hypothetical protein
MRLPTKGDLIDCDDRSPVDHQCGGADELSAIRADSDLSNKTHALEQRLPV